MDSFYDLEGQEINRKTLVELMIGFFRDLVGEEATSITDFNEGSEIRNLLESIALDVFHLEKVTFETMRMSFLKFATGQWLDLHGEKIGVGRDYGNYSTGFLTFTLPKALTYPLVIPYGTFLVHEDNGAVYKTSVDAIIPTGDLSIDVIASSMAIGKVMNAEPDTIRLFQDSPPYSLLSVTNKSKFNGGRDVESDDEYRERLLLYNKQDTFGSVSYYQALALTIEGLHDIAFAEPHSDEYTATILVNGDNKPTPDEIMERALSTFTMQHNLVTGHNFYLTKPTYINTVLTIRAYVEENIDEQEFKDCLNAVFDGGVYNGLSYYGYNIGFDASKLELIMALERIPGVLQVDYILLGDEKVTFDTIDVNAGEVLKLDLSKLKIEQPVKT